MDLLAELAGVASAYEECAIEVTSPQPYADVLRDVIAGDLEAAQAHLGACPTDTAATVSVDTGQLSVLLLVPPGYPSEPVTVEDIAAHSTLQSSYTEPSLLSAGQSSNLEELRKRLTGITQQHATDGSPCFFALLEELLAASHTHAHTNTHGHPHHTDTSHTHPATDTCIHTDTSHSPPTRHALSDGHVSAPCSNVTNHSNHESQDTNRQLVQEPVEILLVRLDHMHNRALYTRTLRGWMSQLGITGRFLLPTASVSTGSGRSRGGGATGSGCRLLLLLLEGSAASLREYLTLHRTQTVDVDSSGRKCRERMLLVLLQQPAPKGQRTFNDYKELAVDSYDQAVEVLVTVGLTPETVRQLVLNVR